jgi:2,4-dienoyl-CoA reductase-like NADH-dependent reductase (Old Yellow Enzyme family)/thioredoxin reductase
MFIGNQELRNEFVMAPVKTGYSDGEGHVTDRHLRFYRRRADHLGAITPEPLYLDSTLRELPSQMGIDADEKIDGLTRLTDAIHDGGAKAIAHLNHPGRMANPGIESNVHWSASATPCERTGVTPERMDQAAIDDAVDLFADGARRAADAGFDVVELQFGHGYLVAQFLSPAVNQREDAYGGSLDDRARFGFEVLEAVQAATDLPVVVRLTADDKVEGGIDFAAMQTLAGRLESRGVDAFHVTVGTLCGKPPSFFQHMFTLKGEPWEYAADLRSQVDVPVMAVGRINDPADVSRIREESMADLIGVGRALVADPDFVGKYTGAVDERIRPCMACSDGCLGGVKSGEGLGCVINPEVGSGEELRVDQAAETASYAVVGGGPAGMSAAQVLAERGHEVTLYEDRELGGAFRYAPLPPGKDPLQKGIDYFVDTLSDADNVRIRHVEAAASDLEAYDGAVVATGSKPVVPPIEGLDSVEHWGAELLEAENLPSDDRVMVIGGGYVGLEAADTLAAAGNEVVVVELLPDLGGDMLGLEKGPLLSRLAERDRVELHRETNLQSVEGDRAVATSDGDRLAWEGIDHYLLATGVRSDDTFADADIDVPLYRVGDAVEPGKAQDAIASGFETAKTL